MAPGAVLVLGGRSEIGLEVVRRIAAGRLVVLAARRADALDGERAVALDAGASDVVCVEFDADDTAAHQELLTDLTAAYGPIAVALVAFGVLGDQQRAERDPAHAVAVVHTDYVAQVSVLTTLATLLRAQHGAADGDPRGHLVVFGSIAGARVRRANYVYGSAKAGLDGFASGLSDALHGSGVHVLLVRPGYVIGRMAAGMEPAPFSSTPAQVADAVVSGLYRGAAKIWVPSILGPVAAVFRLLPQAVWRRMPR
ncbi:MAG: SDR family NAD(P)-dependent oxidoreductase [Mycobacteriaceae bacterium]|nr:SDR family NAD(P)-dependent oxidoreductase [Mycobacteriaceae bacterium]